MIPPPIMPMFGVYLWLIQPQTVHIAGLLRDMIKCHNHVKHNTDELQWTYVLRKKTGVIFQMCQNTKYSRSAKKDIWMYIMCVL